MGAIAIVVPGDVDTRTGGYIYDRRIAAGLRALGWPVDVRNADLAAVPDGTLVLLDGLALPLVADRLDAEASRLRIVPLIHLPLALEPGLPAAEARRRRAIERRAVSAAPLVVVTGADTKDVIESYGAAAHRIAVVEPGTDPAPLARGSGGERVSLLCVAALTPGKGHERLLRALAAVPSREWTLTCAGSLDRDPATADRVRRLARELAVEDRVTLAGELNDQQVGGAYDAADMFVLASVRETYGMAVAEAIARGLAVVSTAVGAIPKIVGAGGLLVRPGDEAALADALTKAIVDRPVRYALTEGARQARTRLLTWAHASQVMAAALQRVSTDGRVAR